MAQGKSERTGKKQVGKHTRIIVTESAEENILETSDNSCSDSSSDGSWIHKKGTEESLVDSTASSEEKSSSSEEDSISEREAMLEDPPVAQGNSYKELLDKSNEASIETEREQVTTDGRNESEDEGTDFAGLEAEERMEKQDDMPRQPKSILAESSQENYDVNLSGFQLESLKNRENINNEVDKENILENDKIQDMSKDAHDNSDSNGENSTEESINKGKENATKQPLPSAVKAKLHVCLSKVFQGTEQEEKVNDEGSALEGSPWLSKQQMTLKEKSGRCEIAEQGKVIGHRQRDSSSDCNKQELAAMMLTKKRSSQSQILLNLKNKHKNAETKLLTSCKPNPVQMALETNSDLKNVESICSKPTTLETLSTQKEPNIAQSFGETRLNLSNIPSCSTITKKSSDKQLLGKKKKVGKVVGKVKLSAGQTLEAKKEKAEEVVVEATSEKENVHDGKGSKYLHTHSAFRKVTSWLGQKPAKKASLKARLLSVARAIGVSRWLLKKFGKRKRSSKPFGFRSRVAIRIVSTAAWLGRSGKAFPGAARHLGRAELSDKESSSLVEGKGDPKTAEEVGHSDLPSGDSPLHGTSSFPYLLSLDENNAPDAKFAIVFPRVHSMIKAKTSLSRGSGNGYSLEKLRSRSEGKSVMPVQQSCRFKSDLPRSLINQSPQRNSDQGFLPHQEEDPIHTSYCSSEVDAKESSGVLQTAGSMVTPHVHWSQPQAQGCDPAAWLNSELLLPRLTIENLSKWAIYKDPHLANSHVMKVCKGQWEAEDITDNMLEMEFMQKQEIEDLTRLEYVLAVVGHSGSGKTEAAKAIVQYLTMLYQRSDSHRIRQPCNVLPILESFGNAKTILNNNSSRFGKICCCLMLSGIVVGTSISQYLLEKSRVVFQAHGERNYHVFYELLAGLPVEQKEEMYLQEAESYFYLNQGRACHILGKEDSQDFLVLVQALEGISLSDDQLTSTWAVLAAILQLGNICFTSYEKESYEHAAIASDTEIQIVANLLRVSADFLQSAVTHRVTVSTFLLFSLLNMLQQQETYLSSPLQATDHTFLQKCHYHHGNSPWYTKPKLPLPVFTVKHYAGPVTYQVHKFLNKNRDQLRPEVLDIFSQSRLEVLEEDDQRFFLLFCRSHIFFIRCITPNPKKLSNIFDVEYVTCQLRHSGILQAIHIRKEGYPVHLPFQNFLARYSSVLAWDSPGLQLQPWFLSYQHLIFQVWPPGWEKAQWLGEERRLCSCAVSCGGEPLRSLSDWSNKGDAHRESHLNPTAILLFSHPSRKRYRRLKKTLVQFNTMILISRHLIQRRKHCQVTALFSGPGVLAGAISALSQYRAQANQITEALPPEVKVKDDLSLPPTINSYPFSSFIKSHFQVGTLFVSLYCFPLGRHTNSSNTRNKLCVSVLLYLCRRQISHPLVSLCSIP
uniref:Myosin motor domain-containing protein n=1 Tax=Otus sunia TaxID=257818 RepID=A0A8C8E8C1_9STRI